MSDIALPAHPVALHRLSLPAHLSGSSGTNRALDRSILRADDDLSALELFLAKYDKSPGTQRLYRKECERLLLWAVYERKKPLSSLDAEDLAQYAMFLKDPRPRARWCGRRQDRDSDAWRPFEGPLGDSAYRTALSALSAFFKWACSVRYLNANPLVAVARPRPWSQAQTKNRIQGRHWDEDMRAALSDALQAMEFDESVSRAEKLRTRMLLTFVMALAARVGEIAHAQMGDFVSRHQSWWWTVLSKGQRIDEVPVPGAFVEQLMTYRQALGLAPLPLAGEQIPLLTHLRVMEQAMRSVDSQAVLKSAPHLTERQLNRILKELLLRASQLLASRDPHKAQRLQRASMHWGRHTSITLQAEAGLESRYIQRNARHRDPRTTAWYTHLEDNLWQAETQKLNKKLTTI